MSPALLRPALALVLAVVLLADAAKRPHSGGEGQLKHAKHVKAPVSGWTRERRDPQEDDGSTAARALGAVLGPLLELLRAQYVVGQAILDDLARLAGAGDVLSLATALAGASSGGFSAPEASEELQDPTV